MNRNIPNKPHPTPDPEKPHSPARAEWGDFARSIHGTPSPPDHIASEGGAAESEEPTYDSCFDDLNMVLSQSMEEPDPDPNLGSGGERPGPEEDVDPESGRPFSRRGKAPRTSEIFRSVMTPAGPSPVSPGSSPAGGPGQSDAPDLGVVPSRAGSTDPAGAGDSFLHGKIPWGQITLLSYSSILTLALIWLLGTGRIPQVEAPVPAAADKPAPEAVMPPLPPPSDTPAPAVPPENVADLGRTIRLGHLDVTPVSVEARAVELVRTIEPRARRRQADCLVLRLNLVNRSKDQTFSPLDLNLVRERDLRSFDPYLATSEGKKIRLFPLAMDSEWSISGQEFPTLDPGQAAETFVVAEPGSASKLADEMRWRVRLRIGVYRVDMLEVKFTRSQVGRRGAEAWDEEE